MASLLNNNALGKIRHQKTLNLLQMDFIYQCLLLNAGNGVSAENWSLFPAFLLLFLLMRMRGNSALPLQCTCDTSSSCAKSGHYLYVLKCFFSHTLQHVMRCNVAPVCDTIRMCKYKHSERACVLVYVSSSRYCS